jgi:N-acetylglutamate synthase-like GNAT family acetyltransferase
LPPIEIRPATRPDAAVIRDLIHTVKINPLSLDWQRFVLAINPSSEILGCAQIKPHGDGTRELASLAVWPRHQGVGVGRALIHHLLASTQPPVYLTCRSSLRSFYEPFGFQPVDPKDMPPYFKRIWNGFRIVRIFLRPRDYLLVMRWDQKKV